VLPGWHLATASAKLAPINDSSVGDSAMRWSAFSLFAILGFLSLPQWANADQDYAVLIISRERLEVPTTCEIGLYVDGQLAGRLFQEQSTSFNLPPGNVYVRLGLLPGQAGNCAQGMLTPQNQNLSLQSGQVIKYRIAMSSNGPYLKRAALEY
jgi:hypothetical protein